MDKLNSEGLIEIFKWDAIIGVIIGICAQLILGFYGLEAMIGIGIAYINFAVNTTVSRILFRKTNSISILLYILSYLFRISLASSIGIIIYTHNMNSVLAYVLGYFLHFVSLVTISTKTLVSKEGK